MSGGKSAMAREKKKLEIGKQGFFKQFERFLDLADYPEKIYSDLEAEGIRLCEEYMSDTPDFFLVESARAQAVAIHGYAVVMVYRGMLDFIFNLASMMAAVTPTPTPPSTSLIPPWQNNMLEWLEQRDFWWGNEEYWWLHCPDHRLVFDSYVTGLFRFVVLHEIGHHHNLHSRGRGGQSDEKEIEGDAEDGGGDNKNSMHKVEPDEGDALSGQQNVQSQAREIIADTYAFQFLVEEMYNDVCCEEEGRGKESGLAVAAVCCALFVVHLYFWGRATLVNQAPAHEIGKGGYPSHVFRIHAIEATFLQHGFSALGEFPASLPVLLAQQQSNQRLAVISARYSFAEWRRETSHPAYEEHYHKICDEVPKWSNGFFGIKDDDLFDIFMNAMRTGVSAKSD